MSPRTRATVRAIRAAKLPPEIPPVSHQIGAAGTETLCLEVPVRAVGARAITALGGEMVKGESFEEDTSTMLLFERGAVIRLAAPVACGHDLMLINKRSNKYVHCWITNVRSCQQVKSYVDVEFTHQAPDFWGITFPKAEAKAEAARAAAPSPMEESAEQPAETHVDVEAVPTLALADAIEAAATATQVSAYTQEKTSALPASAPALPPETEWTAARGMPYLAEALPANALAEAGAPMPERVPGGIQRWEAVSIPRQRRSRFGLAVAAAVAIGICAVTIGYFLIPADEPGFETIPETASPNSAAVAPDVIAQAPAAAPTAPATQLPNSVSRASTDKAGESASIPPAHSSTEASLPQPIKPADPPKRLVLLVSKMNMPVPRVTLQPRDAPEISVDAVEEPGTTRAGSSGAFQGSAGAILAATELVPPPPPETPKPAENAEKTSEAPTLQPARLMASLPPSYPALARQARIDGIVVIEVQIDASGNVTGTNVISGPQMLRDAAVRAVTKWRFEPARLRGQPTASSTVVRVRFQLP